MNSHVFYVVSWMQNQTFEAKTFRYRKSAEKHGYKMMLTHDTTVWIATYEGTKLINEEQYN